MIRRSKHMLGESRTSLSWQLTSERTTNARRLTSTMFIPSTVYLRRARPQSKKNPTTARRRRRTQPGQLECEGNGRARGGLFDRCQARAECDFAWTLCTLPSCATAKMNTRSLGTCLQSSGLFGAYQHTRERANIQVLGAKVSKTKTTSARQWPAAWTPQEGHGNACTHL
jgi:hypothetical protein